MRLLYRTAILLLLALLLAACGGKNRDTPSASSDTTAWSTVELGARGRTVTLAMWQGDPLINRYMKEWVAPELKRRYDLTLKIVGSQGSEVVSGLMTELEAGKKPSAWDMVWINGETFYQLRQINALYGPFVERLPNARYIDFANPFINTDFQQKVDGYECPWGNVQLALIYDTLRTPLPPRTLDELERWVREHPGRFTIDNSFTGMTLLKSFMIALAGDRNALSGPFNQRTYDTLSARLWSYLRRLKPYLWKEGRTFPAGVAQLHQLFANREIDFTMSNNDGEVDNKILQGILPASARAYVLESGTIQNSHFMGITAGSGNREAAMVVANFLISPEAQLHKLEPAVWGDGTVLDVARLPQEWQARFRSVPGRRYAPPRETLQPKALMEPASEYMVKLFDDFRKEIIEKQ